MERHCLLCGNTGHFPSECPSYLTYGVRARRIQALNRCGRCLSREHNADVCRSTLKCPKCHGEGHCAVFCPKNFETSSEQKSEITPDAKAMTLNRIPFKKAGGATGGVCTIFGNYTFKPISNYCRTRQQPTISLLGSYHLHTCAQLELKMSTSGLNLDHLQQLGRRPTSSCDTQYHGTTFYIFNSATKEYEPYVNKFQHGDFNLFRANFHFSQDQQYTSTGHRVAFDDASYAIRHPVSHNRLSTPLQTLKFREKRI